MLAAIHSAAIEHFKMLPFILKKRTQNTPNNTHAGSVQGLARAKRFLQAKTKVAETLMFAVLLAKKTQSAGFLLTENGSKNKALVCVKQERCLLSPQVLQLHRNTIAL